jgi:hypothetical protein
LVLLFVLLLRAYVPLGYMPSAGAPWSLEICPEGMAVGVMAHHHHEQDGSAPDTHGHFAHCPFGAVPGAGPVSHLPGITPAAAPAFATRDDFTPTFWSSSQARSHRARAPPPASHV